VNETTTVTLELNAAPAGDATPLTDSSVELSPLELIQQGINAMFAPTDVVELRVPNAGKDGTLSGYYADHAEMAADLATLDGKHPGIYTTLNPVNPALLARAENRTKSRAQITTSDNDIAQRIHLLIDADPVRPAGISSTDEEKECSRAQTRLVFKHLRSRGWPDPTVADSGNGYHLIYNIDLPNDKESADLVKAVLIALAAQFDTPQSKVDTSVFNAARIVKAYGTLAAKGDDITERPHRRSRVLNVGSDMFVTVEQLRAVAAEVPSPAPLNTSSTGATPGSITPEQIEENLELCGVGHQEPVDGTKPGQLKWILDECPFNPQHVGKDAAVFLLDGIPGFRCLHAHCTDNHWKEFRAQVESASGKRMSFGSSGTVTVGSVAQIIAPVVEPVHTDEMTDAVLDGRLGEICQTRLGVFPLPYAWIALVTAAGTLVPRRQEDAGGVMVGVPDGKPRANLFGCLIGAPGTGKTLTADQVLYVLGMMHGQSNAQPVLSRSDQAIVNHQNYIELIVAHNS